MKKVFFRVLPLAAAVLLATSCSKDENSENNEPVNIVKQEKTVTVTGILSKKSDISKLSCADEVNLTFDGNETLVFSGDGGKIHGETTLNTEAGATVDFTVELSYPADASYDLDGKTVTATIGTEPTGVTGSYSSLNDAAKAVYEVSEPVTINASGNDFSFSGNIVMNVEVAFVKNEKSEAISVKVGDNDVVELAGGKICIVPAGVKVTADGKTKNSTVAGQIYTIEVESEATATSIRGLNEIQGSGKYILEQDIEVDNFNIEENSNIDIDLNGHTITTTRFINVDDATLTLRGSGTIYCAVSHPDPEDEEDEERHDGFSLKGNAVLNLYGNVTITNALSGVELNGNSVLNIYDYVTITNDVTGVALNGNSVLNIYDYVTITNDMTGVFVMETSSKINMYGGTITGCTVGVYAYGNGNDVLNNQGGTISGNTIQDIN